jgi:uncharacterized protein (TIGR02147 family)
VKLIYEYFDYRKFLIDYYNEKKVLRQAFSYQVLANKAGFKSKGYIKDVIDGKKNLSEDSIFLLGRALEFEEQEFDYFKDLVFFNQARTHAQREHFFKRLIDNNISHASKIVVSDNYEFYSCWYHNTIRELVTYVDFNDDYSILAKLLHPQISPKEARQSVELLLKLGMIRNCGDKYEQTSPDITTGDTVASVYIENFHLQNLKLASESIEQCTAGERDISCIVATMDEKQFMEVKKEIQNFRKKMVTLINGMENDAKGKNRVYNMAIQLFPTSK